MVTLLSSLRVASLAPVRLNTSAVLRFVNSIWFLFAPFLASFFDSFIPSSTFFLLTHQKVVIANCYLRFTVIAFIRFAFGRPSHPFASHFVTSIVNAFTMWEEVVTMCSGAKVGVCWIAFRIIVRSAVFFVVCLIRIVVFLVSFFANHIPPPVFGSWCFGVSCMLPMKISVCSSLMSAPCLGR